MNKEEILKLINESNTEIKVTDTEEKIIIEIKKTKERVQTLEELGFSFEVGM